MSDDANCAGLHREHETGPGTALAVSRLQDRIHELEAERDTLARQKQEQIDDKHRILREYEAELKTAREAMEKLPSGNYTDHGHLAGCRGCGRCRLKLDEDRMCRICRNEEFVSGIEAALSAARGVVGEAKG